MPKTVLGDGVSTYYLALICNWDTSKSFFEFLQCMITAMDVKKLLKVEQHNFCIHFCRQQLLEHVLFCMLLVTLVKKCQNSAVTLFGILCCIVNQVCWLEKKLSHRGTHCLFVGSLC